jgi:predicted transcriptional regulator
MNVIQSLSVILEDSIEMFILFKETFKLHMDKFTVKEVSFEEFFKTITSKLKELIEAIERKDSVMISDLLEYEFIPNVEEILKIMNKIKTEAFEKVN